MKPRGITFPFGKAFSSMMASSHSSSPKPVPTRVMTETAIKFRHPVSGEEDSVSVNSDGTFAQAKAKIAEKLKIPAADIKLHRPGTDMTKMHDDTRVMDLPRGGPFHISTSKTASSSSNSQQKGLGNNPESEQTSTYTIEYNKATDGGDQTNQHITRMDGPVNASIRNNTADGKGAKQRNTVMPHDTHVTTERDKLEFELERLKVEIAQMKLAGTNGGTLGVPRG